MWYMVLNNRETSILATYPTYREALAHAVRYVGHQGGIPRVRKGLAFGLIVQGSTRTATIIATVRHPI